MSSPKCITQVQCLTPQLTFDKPDCVTRESCDAAYGPMYNSRAGTPGGMPATPLCRASERSQPFQCARVQSEGPLLGQLGQQGQQQTCQPIFMRGRDPDRYPDNSNNGSNCSISSTRNNSFNSKVVTAPLSISKCGAIVGKGSNPPSAAVARRGPVDPMDVFAMLLLVTIVVIIAWSIIAAFFK